MLLFQLWALVQMAHPVQRVNIRHGQRLGRESMVPTPLPRVLLASLRWGVIPKVGRGVEII